MSLSHLCPLDRMPSETPYQLELVLFCPLLIFPFSWLHSRPASTTVLTDNLQASLFIVCVCVCVLTSKYLWLAHSAELCDVNTCILFQSWTPGWHTHAPVRARLHAFLWCVGIHFVNQRLVSWVGRGRAVFQFWGVEDEHWAAADESQPTHWSAITTYFTVPHSLCYTFLTAVNTFHKCNKRDFWC